MDLKSYKEQNRGGKGVIGTELATGDFVKNVKRKIEGRCFKLDKKQQC